MLRKYCSTTYQIDKDDWIVISDPCPECQHDFIAQLRIKGRNTNNPQFGQLQKFEKGAWVDTFKFEELLSFDGLTGNERLYVSGLITEFDKVKKTDKEKAIKILVALNFDNNQLAKLSDKNCCNYTLLAALNAVKPITPQFCSLGFSHPLIKTYYISQQMA